jgi:hypothetical protein
MTATGGAALVVGIWYQLLGAAAVLMGGDLHFIGDEFYGQLEATGKAREGRSRLVVEYFDMDAAKFDQGKVELYQF